MTVYSDLKILHQHDRLEQIRSGRQIVPVHVQLIISDLCSHSCNFCSYRWDGNVSNQLFHVIDPKTGQKNHNPARFIPYEKIVEILNDCRDMGVRAVQFTGGGEPTVHPWHHEAFRHALDCGLEVALVTHGTLLKPETIETLTRATWVRVSLDAGNENSYAAIRRVHKSQFRRAVNNICSLRFSRDRSQSNLVIGVGFVVTKDNWGEVCDAAWIAREAGADNIRISAVFQPDGDSYFDGFYQRASDLCREAESLSTDRFQVVNMFGNRLDDLRLGHPDYPTCHYQQFTTYIGGNLDVYRCCNLAYNERGRLGSLKEQSFRQLWESQAKHDDFAAFDARGCPRCMFNSKNRTIAYAVDRNAPHVNFV